MASAEWRISGSGRVVVLPHRSGCPAGCVVASVYGPALQKSELALEAEGALQADEAVVTVDPRVTANSVCLDAQHARPRPRSLYLGLKVWQFRIQSGWSALTTARCA